MEERNEGDQKHAEALLEEIGLLQSNVVLNGHAQNEDHKEDEQEAAKNSYRENEEKVGVFADQVVHLEVDLPEERHLYPIAEVRLVIFIASSGEREHLAIGVRRVILLAYDCIGIKVGKVESLD
jgi:hypothetical protein